MSVGGRGPLIRTFAGFPGYPSGISLSLLLLNVLMGDDFVLKLNLYVEIQTRGGADVSKSI